MSFRKKEKNTEILSIRCEWVYGRLHDFTKNYSYVLFSVEIYDRDNTADRHMTLSQHSDNVIVTSEHFIDIETTFKRRYAYCCFSADSLIVYG